LLLFGLAEAVIFAWIFGMDRGWQEMTRGAQLTIPRIVRPVLKYVTPLFLAVILGMFTVTKLPAVLAHGTPEIWAARGLIVAVFVGLAWLARTALAERP
jgi:hypothetical protein